MISVPGGTGDIADAMISAAQMIYASRMRGTDIISYLQNANKLMHETNRIDTPTYQNAEKLCGNIRRLLIASCKTAKEHEK